MSTLIPFQPQLTAPLPTVTGNADYNELRTQLEDIDAILRTERVEEDFITSAVDRWLQSQEQEAPVSAMAQANFQEQTRRALRCGIAMGLLRMSYRGFSQRLADSPLLQWFSGIGDMVLIKTPSKSSLHRFFHWFEEEELRGLTQRILGGVNGEFEAFGLDEPLELDGYFLDTTCVKAAIHFPVDWVLLRDGVRTLVKAILCTRKHGLKHRMEKPERFLERINRLAIEMSQCRRKPDSKKQRKKILRQMKKIVKVMLAHGERYRELIETHWEETDWSRKQAQQVLERIDQMLALLPQAKKQAHERIIGERQVPNKEKLLSLYEVEAQVVIRGKAGAEVEFGNALLIGENPQGLILDWEFYQEVPADSSLVQRSVERVEKAYGEKVQMVGGDRGFDSAENRQWLEDRQIYNGLCPKNARTLTERLDEDEVFEGCQRRRAQTEGRIGILKNQFLGRPLRAKGFAHRKKAVTWGVLAHNLWSLARMRRRAIDEKERGCLDQAA